jgi:hypothetical protein
MSFKPQNPITQEQLKQLVTYEPLTGKFISKVSRGKRVKPGDTLGSVCIKYGYIYMRIDTVRYKAHRLAFLYMLGTIPKQIDHMDTVRDNNIWSNLREATAMQNSHNSNKYSTNTTGVKGLTYYADKRYYFAQITKAGVNHNKSFCLASFESKEAAQEAAITWLRLTRESLHKEYSNHG